MFKKHFVITAILPSFLIATLASAENLKQAEISGVVVKLGQESLELKEILTFEQRVLEEAKPYMKDNPLKSYELMLLIAREYNGYGFEAKALEFYEKALTYKVEIDRTEPLISSVILTLKDKKIALEKIERLKNSNEGKKEELKEWIAMIESHIKGDTILPNNPSSLYFTWAQDSKIEELIEAKKFAEAFRLIGSVNKDANINFKIRYDLLSAATAKRVPPKLWCEDMLQKNLNSLTWSMRICRYLKDRRENIKSSESIETITRQLKRESPERSSWVNALEGL